MQYGPQNLFSQQLHKDKYRDENESFDDYTVRYARTTADSEAHFRHLVGALRDQRFLPAGRQQRAVGVASNMTAFNCFVGQDIHDSMDGIMEALQKGSATLRAGGGKGWNFSTLRPYRELVRGLGHGAYASGPVSFMRLWNSMCQTIMSGGGRRGALMGVLNVSHPDITQFVHAKRVPPEVQVLWDIVDAMPDGPQRMQAAMALQQTLPLTSFNISVAVTDEFMEAVKSDSLFQLRWGGNNYDSIRALDLWSEIMENNWDWAEPGILFIDRINKMNPLAYCETISATNPCAEQPLPPNGACLLASQALVKYLLKKSRFSVVQQDGELVQSPSTDYFELDLELLKADIHASVRAVDNVIDRTFFPLPEQAAEAKAKRRMGLGLTGVANAIETLGYAYGTDGYIRKQEEILRFFTNESYRASIQLAKEKGSFPLFDAEKWLSSGFAKSGVLDDDVIDGIRRYGLRNGLLNSMAPTGTISMAADNMSSGIEPVFAMEQNRLVNMADGKQEVQLNDYAYEKFGTKARTAEEVLPAEHIRVLCSVQKYTDSAVSKTCNVYGKKAGESGPGVTFDEFKGLYMMAYEGGAKGCTTFNSNGKRMGILTAKKPEKKAEPLQDGMACFYDPKTGTRSCE